MQYRKTLEHTQHWEESPKYDALRSNFYDLREACKQDKILFRVLFAFDKNWTHEKLNWGAQPILARIRLRDNVTDMIICVETMK